jgi:uncharacterized protein (UPF0264 family)
LTQLLVSVRNAEEAAIAEEFSIGILDFKDPQRGALGAVAPDELQKIAGVLSSRVVKSAALGELSDWLAEPQADFGRRDDLAGFHYAKVGLAGMGSLSNWQQHWLDFFQTIPSTVIPVGVAYADADSCDGPAIESVLEFAAAQPSAALLIDTHEKRNGSTLEILGAARIAKLVVQARSADLKIVIAGSIQVPQLPILLDCQPDVIGIRGAACVHGRAFLDKSKLARFVSFFCDQREKTMKISNNSSEFS